MSRLESDNPEVNRLGRRAMASWLVGMVFAPAFLGTLWYGLLMWDHNTTRSLAYIGLFVFGVALWGYWLATLGLI